MITGIRVRWQMVVVYQDTGQSLNVIEVNACLVVVVVVVVVVAVFWLVGWFDITMLIRPI